MKKDSFESSGLILGSEPIGQSGVNAAKKDGDGGLDGAPGKDADGTDSDGEDSEDADGLDSDESDTDGSDADATDSKDADGKD